MLSANQSFNKDQDKQSHNNTAQQFRPQDFRHEPVPRSEIMDDIPNNQIEGASGSQVFLDMPIQSSSKSLTKKQKILIAVGVFLAIGIIVGGVVAYKVLSDQESSSEPTIPTTYKQYEQDIKKNQQSNVMELINVPKSQRIYTYTLVNNQTTAQDENNKSKTQTSITHKFGLLCLGVTEFQFDMILYFIDTTMQGNSDKDVANLTGYPKIKDINKQRRNLQQSQDKGTKFDHEFNVLTPKEIQILAEANITPQQFYSSNLPIIRFSLQKDGFISYVSTPINLRPDLQQVYLNILEQLSPIVLKSYYNVNKNRVLSEATQKHNYRMLSGEEVNPGYNAKVEDESTVFLNKDYTKIDEKSVNSHTISNYVQNSKMKNGALQQSNVQSQFSMEDSGDKVDKTKPIFSSLKVESECIIKFVSQQDIVDEQFLKQITDDQDTITSYEFTWSEALDAYKKIYQTSDQVVTSKVDNGRVLQQVKPNFGKSVIKPVFRKTYASMEFGADIQSECGDQSTGGDICTVGLYSFFNGQSIKLVEKQTTVNISRVLKIYQYINNIVNERIFVVQEKIQQNIDAVSAALDDILTKVELTIDVEKNPILGQVKSIVEQDKLNIVSQIKQIEQLIQFSINSANQIIQDPLNLFKGKIVTYVQSKYPEVEKKISEIKNFYTDKYAKIIAFVEKAKQNGGVSSQLKEQVKFLLNHHTQVIAQLVEEPVKKAMEDLTNTIVDQSDKILNNATMVQQLINQNVTSMVDTISKTVNLTSLNLPFDKIPGLNMNVTEVLTKIVSQISNSEQVKSVVNDSLKSLLNNTQIIGQVKNGIKSALDATKNTVISQLDALATTGDAISEEDQKRLDDFKAEMSTIIIFASDLYTDIMLAKKNITDFAENIRSIQGADYKKIVMELATQVLNLPVDLAIKVKDDGVATALQMKSIGLQVYKDVMTWKEDLAKDSKVLLAQAKLVYSEIIDFLTKKDFPEDDPRFYQKPLIEDIQKNIAGVKSLMNAKFNNVTEKYQRLKQLPAKFQKFVTDIKALYQNSIQFFNTIKVTVTSTQIDTGLIGDFVTKTLTAPKQQSQQVVFESLEQEINKPVAQVASQALSLQVEQLVSTDLLQTFSTAVSGQEGEFKNLLKNVLKDIVAQADFSKSFTFPTLSIPVEYVYVYPTPIGVAIKLKLSAKWDTGFGVGFQYKNAILDFSASVNTKVSVTGEVAASIVVAEVGGYAQGTFLDTTVTANVNLKVMENYAGKYQINGSFKPFEVKVGIYYQYIFPTEVVKCGKDLILTPEELEVQTDEVKKAVQAAQNQSWTSKIYNKVKGAVDCLKLLKITPVRKDLFEPYSVKGETYSKLLHEGEF